MPFVKSRGQRIHYTVGGKGPLVIFQHGLLGNAGNWRASGFVDALSGKYRIACVDSLGHGLSDKPSDPQLYCQQQRSGDMVAVIDDLGYERAHFVGYSMGGWISVGMAKYYPQRLSSIVIGGWDVVHGLTGAMPSGVDGPPGFDWVLKSVGAMVPELIAWITPDVIPGLTACWDALSQLEGAEAAVIAAGVPVLLWNGRDDPYHDPMEIFAAVNGLQFLSTDGDHIKAMTVYGGEGAEGIRAFLDST